MSKSDGNSSYPVAPERLQNVGLAIAQIDRAMSGYRNMGIELIGINVKRPKVAGGEFFVVCKGLDGEGTPCVAFHSAFSLGELFMGLEGRLRNGSLKWRVDEYMK